MQPDREQPDAGPRVELAVQESPGAEGASWRKPRVAVRVARRRSPALMAVSAGCSAYSGQGLVRAADASGSVIVKHAPLPGPSLWART